MARTLLTKSNAPGKYADVGAQITWTAADTANGNAFVATGREMLLARNTGVTTRTVSIHSVDNAYMREGDGSISLVAGAYRRTQVFPLEGWLQADGRIWLNGSHVDVEFAVIVVPPS